MLSRIAGASSGPRKKTDVLLKTTNSCGMGCSHCSESSTPAGTHMTEETFLKSLDFTRRVESLAWSRGCRPMILLSGGECTEHPDIVKFIETVFNQKLFPLLITNGMWLNNKDLRESILRPEWNSLFIQVTNDPRFYPTAPPRVDDPRITYVDALSVFIPLGRGVKKKTAGVPFRKGPSSFNLRSLAQHLRSFEGAVAALRARAAMGASGHCTPSVSDNGDVMAGETRACWKLGTVDSSNAELTRAILEMGSCNYCGLESNRRAIRSWRSVCERQSER